MFWSMAVRPPSNMKGILWLSRIGWTAPISRPPGPMMPTAPSTASSLFAAGTASAGSPTVSAVSTVSVLPSTPPALLMQAAAALAPPYELAPTLA